MKPLSLRNIAAVASLLLASSGTASAVVNLKATSTYDDDGCATSSLAIVSAVVDNTCPGASTTTCTDKVKTGCITDSNFVTAFDTAFAGAPYIIRATYTGVANCDAGSLTTLKAYAADGECHSDGASGYFKVTAGAGGLDTTITPYADAACTTAGTPVIHVASADLACTATGASSADSVKFSVRNWPTGLDVAGVYVDCTKDASKLVFTPATANTCAVTLKTCATRISHDCTTTQSYVDYATDAFGDLPYVLKEDYTIANCDSGRGTISVFAADGNCYKDETKSFKVLPNNGGVSVVSFSDTACATIEGTAVDVASAALTGHTCITADTDKSKYYLEGTLPSAVNVAGLYGVAGCSGTPTKLTFTKVASGATCTTKSRTCTTGATTDCTTDAAYLNYAASAFGVVPYLIKEVYTGTNCATAGDIIAYAADGECHADGAGSFKVVLNAGVGVTIKTYAALSCGGTAVTVNVGGDDLAEHVCIGNVAKYYTSETWPVLTAVAVHDVAACGLAPVKLDLTTGACTEATCATTTVGTGTAAKTVYLDTSCIETTNYISEISKAFGMTQFVIQEKYTASDCATVESVAVYAADGACHLGADAASSFKVTLNADGTAKIETFSVAGCPSDATTTTIAAAALTASSCVAADKSKFYVGGVLTKLTAVTTYADNACTNPVQVMFTSMVTCTAPGTPVCTPVGSTGMYVKEACTTDRLAFLESVFEETPRVVTEIFEEKGAAKCGILQGIVAYIADDVCHPTLDTQETSIRITLGAGDGSATVNMFDDADCSAAATSTLSVTKAEFDGHTCDTGNKMKFVFGGTAPTTKTPDTTAAPTATPTQTTAASTGSGTSGAGSISQGSILGVFATMGALVAALA